MHDNSVFCYSFVFINLSDEITQLTMCCPAAAAATGHTQHTIRFVLWIYRKTASAFVKRPLAVVAGAAFLDDMTLNYDNVIFVFHIFSFLIYVYKTFCFDLVNIISDVEVINYLSIMSLPSRCLIFKRMSPAILTDSSVSWRVTISHSPG